MGRLRSSKHDIITLLRAMKKHYGKMRTAGIRTLIWHQILKDCQQDGAFIGRDVVFLFKVKWPGMIRNVAKKVENGQKLNEQEEEILMIERMKNPLFCVVSESDRKCIIECVNDLVTAVVKELHPESDSESYEDAISDTRFSPEPIANLNLDSDDEDEIRLQQNTATTNGNNNNKETENPAETPSLSNLTRSEMSLPMFPLSPECLLPYYQAMDEYIKLCKLKQQETELVIEKTKLSIDVLKKSLV